MSSATFTRPSRGDVLELTIDSLAHGGNGVARLEGYVVFVAGGVPGDRVRAVVGKAKKAYAEARAIEIVEPSPDRVPEVADHPGRAVAGAARTSASSRSRPSRSTTRCTRIGRLDGLRAGADRPRRASSGATATRSSSRSAPAPDGELVCGFHAPGRWNEIVPMADCKLVSERVNELREQVARVLQAATGPGVGPARPARLPAQPRHPRGPPHRPDAGPAGHLARQARRRRLHRRRRRRRPVVDADRRPRREHLRRRDHAAGGRAAADRAPQRPRLPDLARGVLPDQHRDGREALRRRARVRRRCAGTSRSSTSTAGIGTIAPVAGHPRPQGDRPGDRRAGRRRRDRERAHQRDHRTRPSTRATRGWRCASSSSGRASRTSRSSTRRAPASRRRSCAGSSTPRRRGSSTSPATRRRWRRTRPSSSRPATG